MGFCNTEPVFRKILAHDWRSYYKTRKCSELHNCTVKPKIGLNLCLRPDSDSLYGHKPCRTLNLVVWSQQHEKMTYEEQVARDLEDLKDYLSDREEDEGDDCADIVLDETFKSTIVVDNLPLTTKEKMPKLLDILTKIYSQMGELSENGIFMPFDEETGKTSG